jgi:hypothetical protein
VLTFVNHYSMELKLNCYILIVEEVDFGNAMIDKEFDKN